jgi:O-antigen ligase
MTLDRARLAALADYLAAAAVVSLPWSTSATSILLPIWAVVAVLTLDRAALRQVLPTPPAVLPVALVVLAVLGILWSDAASLPERFSGLSPFAKLLVIPLLFMQFSRSGRSEMVLTAFLASASVLLAVSWLLVLFPQIPWPVQIAGVPVKDYIIQSAEFALCGFVLLDRALSAWGYSRVKSMLLAGLALLFLGDLVFVVLSRTSVVVIVVLFCLLGLRHFERRALAAYVAAGVALAAITWTASPYLRSRVTHVIEELDASQAHVNETSAGARVGFWKMSVNVIQDAPLIGHGTGSIKEVFARAAVADPTAPTGATNPHNQILAIAVQFGLLGAVLLIAMWAAHFRMFLYPGPMAWVGLSVVAQNVVSSLFNSHLSDFSNGWLYVFGLGIAGGVVLRERSSESKTRADETTAAAPSSGLEPAVGPAE